MIYSMTAFASVSEQWSCGMITCEIRSVNHRYFDCTMKISESLRHIEASIRSSLQKKLYRGHIECMIKFQPSGSSDLDLKLNTILVKKIANVVDELKNYFSSVSVVDPMKVLSLPNVLQIVSVDVEVDKKIIFEVFEKTLSELVIVREREGAVLVELVRSKVKELLKIIIEIRNKVPQILADQRKKIIIRLEEIKSGLDQVRLEQEMVYLAQKIDISEELDRLETHSKEIDRILNVGGCIGKRLDFLMQELNRESNTLASKSIDIDIVKFAVELRVLIEQMREQVQNIV